MNSPSTYTKLLFVSLLTVGHFAQAQDFSAVVDVTGGSDTYYMTFGFSPDATDGYDDGLDQYAPPAPPPPAPPSLLPPPPPPPATTIYETTFLLEQPATVHTVKVPGAINL